MSSILSKLLKGRISANKSRLRNFRCEGKDAHGAPSKGDAQRLERRWKTLTIWTLWSSTFLVGDPLLSSDRSRYFHLVVCSAWNTWPFRVRGEKTRHIFIVVSSFDNDAIADRSDCARCCVLWSWRHSVRCSKSGPCLLYVWTSAKPRKMGEFCASWNFEAKASTLHANKIK